MTRVWLQPYALTYSLIHLFTHSLTHSLTYSLTHLFTHSLIRSITYSSVTRRNSPRTHTHTHTHTPRERERERERESVCVCIGIADNMHSINICAMIQASVTDFMSIIFGWKVVWKVNLKAKITTCKPAACQILCRHPLQNPTVCCT